MDQLALYHQEILQLQFLREAQGSQLLLVLQVLLLRQGGLVVLLILFLLVFLFDLPVPSYRYFLYHPFLPWLLEALLCQVDPLILEILDDPYHL